MKQLPQTKSPLVLRTDFSNQTAWEAIYAATQVPVGIFRFRANVQFLDDINYAGISKDQILQLTSKNYNHSFIVIADQITMTHPEHPLMVVDLFEGSGRAFRATPSTIQAIENNLSIANMDFDDFAEAVGEDGVFRGFSRDV